MEPPFWRKSKNKALCPAFCAFLDKLQIFFDVVGHCREVHTFVGLCQAQGVYLAKAHKLGKCSEYGFHRALPFALHIPTLWAVYPGNVTLVLCTIIGNAELLFLCTFGQTTASYGAVNAYVLASSVFLFSSLRSAIQKLLGKRNGLSLRTAIIISVLNVNKTIGAALERAVGRNKTLKTLSFKESIVFSAAVKFKVWYKLKSQCANAATAFIRAVMQQLKSPSKIECLD